jgi:hypothetical protein
MPPVTRKYPSRTKLIGLSAETQRTDQLPGKKVEAGKDGTLQPPPITIGLNFRVVTSSQTGKVTSE